MKISPCWFVLGLAGAGLAAPITQSPDEASLAPLVRDTRRPFRDDGGKQQLVLDSDVEELPNRDAQVEVIQPQSEALPDTIPSSFIPVLSLDVANHNKFMNPIIDSGADANTGGHAETLGAGRFFTPVLGAIRYPGICLYTALASTSLLAILFMVSSLLLLLAACFLPERPPVGASPAPCWLDQSCSEKDQLRDGDERRKGHAAPAVGDYDDRLVVLYDEVM